MKNNLKIKRSKPKERETIKLKSFNQMSKRFVLTISTVPIPFFLFDTCILFFLLKCIFYMIFGRFTNMYKFKYLIKT